MSSSRLYVGHLSHRARERDIEDFFGKYGRVREVLLKNGFGFVEFDDPRDAEEAVYRCNGKELRGERVIVELTKRPPRGRDNYRSIGGRHSFSSRRSPARNPAFQYSQTKYKLHVKNLSSRLSWQDLKDMFRSVGEVMYADAHRQKKNEGVVCFACYSDMKKAKAALNGKEYNGRKLELFEADQGRSRSRSRTHSKSKSRSRSPRSRSKSRSKSRSRSRRSSHSRSKSSHSRSTSHSPTYKADQNGNGTRFASRSASRSKSRSRSVSIEKKAQ